MSKYEKNFGNIKINFKGKVSSQKIIEDLASILIKLQKDFDIEEFSGVNFYCNLYKDDEPQRIFPNNDLDRPITGFVVKSNSSHKTITKQEDGSKNYKFEKDFNFEKFKHSIEEKVDFSSLLAIEDYSLMNKKEFEKEIRERDEKLKILEERQKIINEEKQEIIREQQEIEEKIINDFRERIKIDFNVKEEDFNKKISSIGKIVSPRVIKKYLSDFDNLDKEYFRMTIKNQETGRAGDIYIYNMKHEMIKKIERE